MTIFLSTHLHWPEVGRWQPGRAPGQVLFSVLVSARFMSFHAVLTTVSRGRYDHCPHWIDENTWQRTIRKCKIARLTGLGPRHSGSRAHPLDRDSELSHLEVGARTQCLSHGSGKGASARHGHLLSVMGSSLSSEWEVLVRLANPKSLWPHLKNRCDNYSYFYINYVKQWTQRSYLISYIHYNCRGPALVIPAVQGARSLALRLGRGEVGIRSLFASLVPFPQPLSTQGTRNAVSSSSSSSECQR